METSEAISRAMTVREYDRSKSLDKSSIRKIIDAGRMTASARNMQAWSFIAITDRDLLGKIADLSPSGRHISNAAFAIAVVTDPQNRWSEIDSTRAVQSMTIEAWDLGLGNSWVGSIDRDKVKDLLKIPRNLNILTILPFGFPTKNYKGKKSRKPFDDVAYLNQFGIKFN
ncbi:MAG: nitroreductase family protein [Thaumarchaeota archaeon]|nr:nitroreductase family protein [Nitrososphaerota archaeon]